MDLKEIQRERELLESHATWPQFARKPPHWVTFDADARAFAANQHLPADAGTSAGLPPGWLSEFVACAAFVGADAGDEPRRLPKWVPADVAARWRSRTSEPEGALFVLYGAAEFVVGMSFLGRVTLFVWPEQAAVNAARLSLARKPVKTEITATHEYVPATVTYPHKIAESDLAAARAVAHFVGADNNDTAVWLAAKTLLMQMVYGPATLTTPAVHVVGDDGMPAVLHEERRREIAATGVSSYFEEMYGDYACPVGRVVDGKYYFWKHSRPAWFDGACVDMAEVKQYVSLWKNNTPALAPERVERQWQDGEGKDIHCGASDHYYYD